MKTRTNVASPSRTRIAVSSALRREASRRAPHSSLRRAVVRSPAAVFFLTKPDRRQIDRFLSAQRNRTFSYREVGASRRASPAGPTGYTVDHNRVQLGEGRAAVPGAPVTIRDLKPVGLVV